MTAFTSDPAIVKNDAQTIYGFLSDFSNFEKIMPDQVTNWQTSGDTCSFTIPGLATLGMKIQEKVPHQRLHYVSQGKVPAAFDLVIRLAEPVQGSTEVIVCFEIGLNPVMRMMAEKPLQNFVNILAGKIKELFEK